MAVEAQAGLVTVPNKLLQQATPEGCGVAQPGRRVAVCLRGTGSQALVVALRVSRATALIVTATWETQAVACK